MIKSKKIILIGGLIAILSYITWHELKHPLYKCIKVQMLNPDHENYKYRAAFWYTNIEKQFKFLDFNTPKNVGYISNLGRYLGGSLIFLGLAMQEKNNGLKYLGFGTISFFSTILFFSYSGNFCLEYLDIKLNLTETGFFNNLLKTTILIRFFNLTFIISCLIYCIWSVRSRF